MLQTIRNQKYTVKVDSFGAQLKSFNNNETGEEFIWQGDPNIWKSSAPVLFPIIGQLKDDQFEYNKKRYTLPRHGFARDNMFEITSTGENKAVFKLVSNADIQKCYPFLFEFEVSFTLSDARLQVDYTVVNCDTKDIYFSVGSHPAIRLPLENCDLEDYFVEFEKKENPDLYLLKDNLINNEPRKNILKEGNILPITKDVFNDDALIFKNITSKWIAVKNNKTQRTVILETGGAPHLGVWAKPGAPYVCIEPWFSYADAPQTSYDITQKQDITRLSPGQTFLAGYAINV